MMPSNTARDDVQVNGKRPGNRSQYRVPNVIEARAECGRVVRRADRLFAACDSVAAYQVLRAFAARFAGFICAYCGRETDGAVGEDRHVCRDCARKGSRFEEVRS